MDMLTATLALYREAATDAARSLAQGVWGVLALAVAHLVLFAVGTFVSLASGGDPTLRFVLGFLQGFAHAAVVGWYLGLVELGVTGRRRVGFNDLTDRIGVWTWEVISVLFIFWIASEVLATLGGGLVLIGALVATVVFNPAPEQIYQDRTTSLDLLGEGARFMQRAWPEWLGAHALVLLGLVVLSLVAPGGLPALGLITLFGPFFGFIDAPGSLLGHDYTPASVAAGLVMLVVVHATMLFRGHLYKRLRASSRRSRAWQQRMGR
jgi:hypothetical protein